MWMSQPVKESADSAPVTGKVFGFKSCGHSVYDAVVSRVKECPQTRHEARKDVFFLGSKMRGESRHEPLQQNRHTAQGPRCQPGRFLSSFPSINVRINMQAMLYATDGVSTDADFQKAMVGVGSVW